MVKNSEGVLEQQSNYKRNYISNNTLCLLCTRFSQEESCDFVEQRPLLDEGDGGASVKEAAELLKETPRMDN
jgi:hypothetical protein